MSKSDEMCIVLEEEDEGVNSGNPHHHHESQKNHEISVSSERVKCQAECDKKQFLRSLKFLVILAVLQLLSYLVTYLLPVFLRPFSASSVWEIMHLKVKSWIILGSFLTRSVLWIIIIILNGTFRSILVKKVRALALLVPLIMELIIIGLIISSLLSSHDSKETSPFTLYGFSLFFSTLIVFCIIKMIFACFEDHSTMTNSNGTDNQILDSNNETNNKDPKELRNKTAKRLLSFCRVSSKPTYQRSYNEGRKL